jgi:D-alanine-D-alanine ligase
MKLGITFDLKLATPAASDVPDDAYEEFDSPQTIEAIARVLRGRGHEVVLLGDGREFLDKVLAEKPDFVFNFAEGHGISRSREARVPAVLEMLGIPYSGSDPFTLAVTLDKDCAKKLVAPARVLVPASFTLDADVAISKVPRDALRFPLVVKPAWEGSSKGIRNRCLVHKADELADVVASLRATHRQTLLLEEFIAGEEVTVGVIGNHEPRVLGMLQVVPKTPTPHFLYSLEVKRDYHQYVTFNCPPNLPAITLDGLAQAALVAYRTLGCRDVARVDFRVRAGVPYFLEVNPIPGLHPVHSDLVLIAYGIGWTYEKLVGTILDEAFQRLGLRGGSVTP